MSKYDALAERLARASGARLEMTFDDIAGLVAGGLPPSAYRYPAWWANDPSHVQSGSWLHRGFRTEQVDLAGRRVMFARSS